MSLFAVYQTIHIFLSLVQAAIFVYWILTMLRFRNQFVLLLAKFIYPFIKPFHRPATWVMKRTGLPIDFTLFFAMIGLSLADRLVYYLFVLF